jgi:hypothetical protein
VMFYSEADFLIYFRTVSSYMHFQKCPPHPKTPGGPIYEHLCNLNIPSGWKLAKQLCMQPQLASHRMHRNADTHSIALSEQVHISKIDFQA